MKIVLVLNKSEEERIVKLNKDYSLVHIQHLSDYTINGGSNIEYQFDSEDILKIGNRQFIYVGLQNQYGDDNPIFEEFKNDEKIEVDPELLWELDDHNDEEILLTVANQLKWIHWEFMGNITIENYTKVREEELEKQFSEVYALTDEEHKEYIKQMFDNGTAFEYMGVE